MLRNIVANIVALTPYSLAALWFFNRLAEYAEAKAIKEMMKGFRRATEPGFY